MGKVADVVATMIANLEAKTGKPLAAWVKLVQAEKFEKHSERVAFLKSKHGLGHGYANLVATRSQAAALPHAVTIPSALSTPDRRRRCARFTRRSSPRSRRSARTSKSRQRRRT